MDDTEEFKKRDIQIKAHTATLHELVDRHCAPGFRLIMNQLIDLLVAQAADHGRLSGLELASMAIDDSDKLYNDWIDAQAKKAKETSDE